MPKERTSRHTFSFTLDGAELSNEMQEQIATAVRKAALFEIVDMGLKADIGRRIDTSCGGCQSVQFRRRVPVIGRGGAARGRGA